MSNQIEPFFLFVGESDHDTATSKLAVAGIQRIKKKLESGVENWRKIIDIMSANEIAGVIGKFTNASMARMSHPSYGEVTKALLMRLSEVPHVIFIHDSFFTGEDNGAPDDSDDPYFGAWHYFRPLPEAIRDQMRELFLEYDINVVPFRRNVEVSVIAGTFIDEHQNNMLFRFYVPDGKMWANETKTILDLFREYLAKAGGLEIRQNHYSTGKGTVYEFFGDYSVTQEIVSREFESFSAFMDACVADPSRAETMLALTNVAPQAVAEIVTRYSKQAARLQTDLKHDRERKVLSIRQRMESELVDVVEGSADWDAISKLVDTVIPSVPGVSLAFGLGTSTNALRGVNSVTLNMRPQIIQQVHGIVAQEVSGTQNFGPEPLQLLEIIERFAGNRTLELTSAVYELEDTAQSAEVRLTAAQKLKGFLLKGGEKMADMGVGLLQAYIQQRLGLGG